LIFNKNTLFFIVIIYMKVIEISASPKQLSRLRNGHKVRVKSAMAGKGVNMIVDPSKFDTMSRAFTKGTAAQIQLSPDELKSNKDAVMAGEMTGQGIFAGGKLNLGKSFKKVGSTLAKAGKSAIKGIRTAEQAVRKDKTARAIVRKALPLVTELGVTAGLTALGADPATAKTLGKVSKIGSEEGLKRGGYGKGLYAGNGLYAGAPMAGRGLPAPPSRLPELSSISVGGTLMAPRNPNLASDAMSANFHMNTQLLPQYQRGGIKFV